MKKALSIFLSLVMLLTMSAGLNITARAEQSVKSSFDEATGTLTFTGKGTVSASSYDYGNIGDKIRKVIVNVGIDEIQSYAFSKADKLQSVIIYDQTCQISAQGILPIGKDDVTFYGFDKSKTQEWALNHKYPFKYIYTITFLKRDNSVSKIIYALDGETAQEISAKAPNFSFAAYPYTGGDMNNAHYAPVWKPSISAATSDKQYKEHPKLRMCTGIQKITKEPTCAETGVLSTVCSICGRTLETKELAKTDNHVFDNNEEFCLVCHKVKILIIQLLPQQLLPQQLLLLQHSRRQLHQRSQPQNRLQQRLQSQQKMRKRYPEIGLTASTKRLQFQSFQRAKKQ